MRPLSAGEQALLSQASAMRQGGRPAEAATAYQSLLSLRPDLTDAWYNLGLVLRRAGRYAEALEAYGEALKRGVSAPEEVHLNRAVILADDLARPEDARAELDRALALNAKYLPALINLGNLNDDLGRREAARATYERALAIDADNPLALSRLAASTQPVDKEDPLVERVASALGRARDPASRAELGFALGRLLDACGDYDGAFDAYSAANRASRLSTGARYDPRLVESFVDRMVAAFPDAGPPSAGPEAEAPIFVCGLFRSGSTLVERILTGHPELRSGGELDILPRLIGSALRPWPEAASRLGSVEFRRLASSYLSLAQVMRAGGGRLIDKRPDNFLNIGLIKRLFPSARIVHTIRDPRDVCLSNWMLHLDPSMPHALDLDDMAHWHGQYARLMSHWKALWPSDIWDLSYDDLVADPQVVAGAVMDFLGLEWRDDLLDFPHRPGAVQTASVWQVREAIYTRSSGRWINYAHRLSPAWLASLQPRT